MKNIGFVLLIAGFLMGAYATALDVQNVNWQIFAVAAVAALAGLVLIKRAAAAHAQSDEVLELNRDLFILEEELLFPANTQVAVFVSMDTGNFFALDSVQLSINDKEVGKYLYTKREVEALYKGGVQRLYLGNLKTGEHELVAVFTGKGPHGRDYRRATSLNFEKGLGARFLELSITDSDANMQPEFQVREWE